MGKIISVVKRLGITMRKGLEKAKKRGVGKERLRERIKVFGRIVWLEKWKKMSFKEKVEFAKKRYGVKEVSRRVTRALRELEKGEIDIGRIKGKEFVVALPWLYELSFSENWETRWGVAHALGEIGVWNESVVEMLMRLSVDEDWVIRGKVAHALGRIGVWNESVREMLERLSGDINHIVREGVFKSLQYMKIDKSVKERLIENIKLTNEIVEVARGYFEKLDYEKSQLVIESLFRKKFNMERFLEDENYRKKLFDLVKAMDVEKLRGFVFGKK